MQPITKPIPARFAPVPKPICPHCGGKALLDVHCRDGHTCHDCGHKWVEPVGHREVVA